jgi:hypothetical protein
LISVNAAYAARSKFNIVIAELPKDGGSDFDRETLFERLLRTGFSLWPTLKTRVAYFGW